MSQSLWDIPELSHSGGGRGLVRVPIEQDVPFTPRVRALVDTTAFQRLHHITQLGLASRVYPGATHTRFEHALGVYHNALRYLEQLGGDQRFREIIDPHHAEVLIVSALLHDLGHWPFCHPIEDMKLDGVPPHEEFAAEFLQPGGELADVLEEHWGINSAEVLDILAPRTDSAALRLMRSILSGPIDIDKMDYLDRDSLHAGVPYGRNFDRNRLIQSLLLNKAGDGLAISAEGRTAAEMMVFARYVMFSEVFWHHAVRSATCMFARMFFALHSQLDLRAFFKQSEAEMIRQLRELAHGTTSERLAEGIFGPRRMLYKRVAEYSIYQSPEAHSLLARRGYVSLVDCATALAEIIGQHLHQPIEPTDLLIDAPPPQREVEFNVDLYFPKEQVYRPLYQVSPVVDTLARRQFDDYVKRVRIFAHPRVAEMIGEEPRFATWLKQAIDSVFPEEA